MHKLKTSHSSCARPLKLLSHLASFFFNVRNPSIDKDKWPLFTPENREYITLNTSLPEKKTKLKAKKCHFWSKIFPQMMSLSGKIHTIYLHWIQICYDTHCLMKYLNYNCLYPVCPQMLCRLVVERIHKSCSFPFIGFIGAKFLLLSGTTSLCLAAYNSDLWGSSSWFLLPFLF